MADAEVDVEEGATCAVVVLSGRAFEEEGAEEGVGLEIVGIRIGITVAGADVVVVPSAGVVAAGKGHQKSYVDVVWRRHISFPRWAGTSPRGGRCKCPSTPAAARQSKNEGRSSSIDRVHKLGYR